MQKTSGQITLYSRNEKVLKGVKNGHFAWAIVRQNGEFGSEIEKAKNIPKTTLFENLFMLSVRLSSYGCKWLLLKVLQRG